MKTILETFKKSLYNPEFYKNAGEAPLGEAIRYYVKAALVLTLIMTVMLGVMLIPQGISFIKDRAPYLVNAYYPKELSVRVEKGVASANVEMPYFVSLKTFSKATTTGAVENMLVIDTENDFSRAVFEGYSTYALLTKTDIVTRDENGAITIQPLGRTLTATINQEVLFSLVEDVQNYLGRIIAFGLFATLIIVFSGFLMYLIPVLLFALIPKFIGYIKKTPISYGAAYKMSLYAIVPALALKTLINSVGIFFLPSYFTLLVFLLIISLNMRETPEPTLFENK